MSGKSMRMARSGRRGADGALELAELAVDAGQVQDDFGDAHDGHVFSADDAVKAGGGHARAAHAVAVGVRADVASWRRSSVARRAP